MSPNEDTKTPNSRRDELDGLRESIRGLDAEIMDLVSRRITLARRAGDLKRNAGLPIRNYVVEAEVIAMARAKAEAEGLPAQLAEDLVKMLIQASLRAQERDRIAATRRDARGGRRALVVGGAGQMGRWFVDFLDGKGFSVSVADPRGAPSGYPEVTNVPETAHAFDVIVIATPPSTVGPVLRSLAGRTDALIFEIGSLKAPFLDDLHKLAASGAFVTSVHPMWGPRTDLLASKNVLVCSCGNEAADRAARALFEDTAARLVDLPVHEHDAHMAQTLGLPHALNLVFGHALSQQADPLSTLLTMGGPTFVKQTGVSREVASENKDLYYEIQRLNPHTDEALASLRRSLDDLEASLASREAFRAYMAEAERYFLSGGAAP